MINEQRTRMMTKLALYESKRGKKELQITRYAPGDYVTAHMLWSFVCGTIAFVIVLALWVLYNIESLLIELFSMDIMHLAINILLVYIIYMGLYLGMCYVYISYRYGRYKKRVNKFLLGLKELYRQYVQSDN
ncbi:MAG: hypothetical protein IKK03_11410 [Lachnospiraceae bacterium]|nr:hypothetical protein [Lachnospiraceae bacterium]MBR4060434.1 hypothetical protein [Lachnospiraceae bacterium]